MNEKSYKFYVGIDVAKAKLDVVISNRDGLFQIENNEDGFKALAKQLPNKKKTLIVLEASGGYEQSVAQYLQNRTYDVAVVNAKRVRDFAKASGKLAKTDSIDANVILDFARAFCPNPQPASTQDAKERLSFLNRRSQLVEMIVLEKQHLEKAASHFSKHILRHIRYLEKELSRIESALKKLIDQDPELKDKVERLDEIKGVGRITAMTVALYMPELGRLTGKEISALTGVAPFNKDSGQMKGRRQIGGGRAGVRSALYMAILSARKFNPAIRRFYDRLIERGKLPKVAMVACMRKLIITMNAMMRDGSSWQLK